MTAKVTAVILAGGKSSRFGSDKAFIKIKGAPLIRKQIKILKKIFKKIIIVTNAPHKYRANSSLRGSDSDRSNPKNVIASPSARNDTWIRNVKIVQDIIKNCGPLAGIYSGLMASDSFYNFVVACDMPFIKASLIRYILRNKNSYDIIIPKIDKKTHPLFGVYSKNCIPVIERRFMEISRRIKVESRKL